MHRVTCCRCCLHTLSIFSSSVSSSTSAFSPLITQLQPNNIYTLHTGVYVRYKHTTVHHSEQKDNETSSSSSLSSPLFPTEINADVSLSSSSHHHHHQQHQTQLTNRINDSSSSSSSFSSPPSFPTEISAPSDIDNNDNNNNNDHQYEHIEDEDDSRSKYNRRSSHDNDDMDNNVVIAKTYYRWFKQNLRECKYHIIHSPVIICCC